MFANVQTYCAHCGKRQSVRVEFPDAYRGFKTRKYECVRCEKVNTLQDEHTYVAPHRVARTNDLSVADRVGAPLDYVLARLEKYTGTHAHRPLEDFSSYIGICTVLTKLEDGERVTRQEKEQCYAATLALIDWVFLGEAISTYEWLQQVLYEYDQKYLKGLK